MSKCLLVSEKYIKSNSLINDNVDTSFLYPAIESVQDIQLQQLIGTKLYNKLQDLVVDGSITADTNSDYKVLLDEYIVPYLLHGVTASIQIPLAFKFRNQGLVQQTGENTYVPSMKDIQYVVQHYQNQADFYGNRMTDYIRANRSKYPEYCKVDSCADMHANPDAYNTGIYLG